jgi:hypothetical protein
MDRRRHMQPDRTQHPKRGWFARWRDRRRARRQEALERQYLEHQRRRASGTPYSTPSAYRHTGPVVGGFGFGGDGGGGDGGGGC